jgi:hypothetical protein
MTEEKEDRGQIVYWHRELPPVDAEMVSEHQVEAASSRIAGSIARGDAAWDQRTSGIHRANDRRTDQGAASVTVRPLSVSV